MKGIFVLNFVYILNIVTICQTDDNRKNYCIRICLLFANNKLFPKRTCTNLPFLLRSLFFIKKLKFLYNIFIKKFFLKTTLKDAKSLIEKSQQIVTSGSPVFAYYKKTVSIQMMMSLSQEINIPLLISLNETIQSLENITNVEKFVLETLTQFVDLLLQYKKVNSHFCMYNKKKNK